MSSRFVPATRRIALILAENVRGFAALAALSATLYALYAAVGDGVHDWMNVATRLVAVLVPLAVVGSFREAATGGADLWLQKPVGPLGFHLARFLEVAFVAVVATVLFRCVAAAVAMATGWEPDGRVLQPVAAEALTAVVVVAVGFGFSSWGGDRGRMATAVYLAVSVLALLQIGLSGNEAAESMWVQVVRAASFPLGARQEVASFLAGRADFDWPPATWLLTHAAAWVAVGAAGHSSLGRRAAK